MSAYVQMVITVAKYKIENPIKPIYVLPISGAAAVKKFAKNILNK